MSYLVGAEAGWGSGGLVHSSVLVGDGAVLSIGNGWEGKFWFVFFCHHFFQKEYCTGKNILLHSIMYNCFVATTNIILSKKKPS